MPWTRTTRVQGQIYFNVLFHHAAARLHIFLAVACNGARDWQACGCWPMSSLDTNVLLLFLIDAGEYNILSLQLVLCGNINLSDGRCEKNRPAGEEKTACYA